MISPKVLTLPIRQNPEDHPKSPSYSSTSPNPSSSLSIKPFIFIPRSTDNNIQPKTPTSSDSKMTNFSIAAIMNNGSGSQKETGDLGFTSISEAGLSLTNRLHQQQLTSLREHAFLQLGRRGFEESNLSPISKYITTCSYTIKLE